MYKSKQRLRRNTRLPALVSCFAVIALLNGCSFSNFRAKLAATIANDKEAIAVAGERVAELEQAAYSFADRYVTALSDSCDKAAANNVSREAIRQALRLKLHNASSAYAIVTGPNPLGQLLDLATIVTLNKFVYVDEGEAIRTFGDRHAIIEEAFTQTYEDVWQVAGRFLKPSETESVKKIIKLWRKKNPDVTLVSYVRFDDFSRARAGLAQEAPEIGGLFDRIDEVNRTMQTAQQFGERALFYAQRMPRLLQWQTERTVEAVLENGDLEKLQDTLHKASSAATMFANEAKHFDRTQAGLQESLARVSAIIEQTDKLMPSVKNVMQEGQTLLTAVQDTNAVLGNTLQITDKLSGQFIKAREIVAANIKPFDIKDLIRALTELSDSLQQAQGLLNTVQTPELNKKIGTLSKLVDDRIDHIAWRLTQLSVMVFVFFLLGRFVTARLMPR